MAQQRLNMLVRKKSIVDEEFEKELSGMLKEIREQSQAISDKIAELYNVKDDEQNPSIFDDEGNLHVDDDKVRQIIQPMKDHLKVLKQKYRNKKALEPKMQHEASRQSDIFDL